MRERGDEPDEGLERGRVGVAAVEQVRGLSGRPAGLHVDDHPEARGLRLPDRGEQHFEKPLELIGTRDVLGIEKGAGSTARRMKPKPAAASAARSDRVGTGWLGLQGGQTGYGRPGGGSAEGMTNHGQALIPREKVGTGEVAAFAVASQKGDDRPAATAPKPRTLRRDKSLLKLCNLKTGMLRGGANNLLYHVRPTALFTSLFQCGMVKPNDVMTVGSRVRDVSSMIPIPGLKSVHIDQP